MSRPTFAGAWQQYRTWLLMEQNRRPRTVSAYRFALWHWRAWLEAKGKTWDQVTTRDLGRYLNRPIVPRARRNVGGNLAAPTRSHYGMAIRQFYRYATEQGWFRRDPMAGFRPPRQDMPVPRSLPVADLRTILLAAAGDERLECMLACAFFAGMRAGELAKARIEHVRLDERPRIEVPDGKGGRARTVPLHPELERILRGYLSRRARQGPLFESLVQPGMPIGPAAVSRLVSGHLKALGISGTTHSLRHSAATEMLRAARGRNLEEVRAFLGHQDSKTTRRYVSAYDFDVASAVAALPDPRAASHA